MAAVLDIPPLDCFRLLAEMHEYGVNNSEAARRMGVAPSTVKRWKSGEMQPGWVDGQRLLLLHEYVRRENATETY